MKNNFKKKLNVGAGFLGTKKDGKPWIMHLIMTSKKKVATFWKMLGYKIKR